IGSYSVSISNQFGITNSNVATLAVSARPAPQTSLGVDFNNRNPQIGETADKFESFVLVDTGATLNPTTKLFGGPSGVEVTVVGANGTTVDSRKRLAPSNAGSFTQEQLLQDFVFSPPTTGTDGLDVTLKFLTPNRTHSITIWSFDSSNGGVRLSDWFANGVLVKNDYSFDGNIAPTNDLQNQFTFDATSDAQGTILIQGRREETGSGVSVFLNALKIEVGALQMRITKIEQVSGNIRLTVETPDSSKAHSVEQTTNLSTAFTGPVSGMTTTVLSPTSLQLEFAQPVGGIHFYRINRAP
ncbi:MAG TPA: hypothetical protein VM260_08570, partial [Pirellula sp.]|nr:hypothetical protein [Pirellula sp.]